MSKSNFTGGEHSPLRDFILNFSNPQSKIITIQWGSSIQVSYIRDFQFLNPATKIWEHVKFVLFSCHKVSQDSTWFHKIIRSSWIYSLDFTTLYKFFELLTIIWEKYVSVFLNDYKLVPDDKILSFRRSSIHWQIHFFILLQSTRKSIPIIVDKWMK